MTMATTGSVGDLYAQLRDKTNDPKTLQIIARVIDYMLGFKWASSGLAENNVFTTTIVLRTVGMLARYGHGDQPIT